MAIQGLQRLIVGSLLAVGTATLWTTGSIGKLASVVLAPVAFCTAHIHKLDSNKRIVCARFTRPPEDYQSGGMIYNRGFLVLQNNFVSQEGGGFYLHFPWLDNEAYLVSTSRYSLKSVLLPGNDTGYTTVEIGGGLNIQADISLDFVVVNPVTWVYYGADGANPFDLLQEKIASTLRSILSQREYENIADPEDNADYILGLTDEILLQEIENSVGDILEAQYGVQVTQIQASDFKLLEEHSNARQEATLAELRIAAEKNRGAADGANFAAKIATVLNGLVQAVGIPDECYAPDGTVKPRYQAQDGSVDPSKLKLETYGISAIEALDLYERLPQAAKAVGAGDVIITDGDVASQLMGVFKGTKN